MPKSLKRTAPLVCLEFDTNAPDYGRLEIMEHPSLHESTVVFGQNTKQWSTMGDLHANGMNFYYFAAQRGAIQVSPENFHKLAVIYNNWGQPKYIESRKAEKKEFEGLMATVDVASGSKLRLIGDELGDRGMDGTFVLEELFDFKQKGGIYETILSNHTAGFILCIEEAIRRATVHGVLNEQLFIDILTELLTPIEANNSSAAVSFRNLKCSLKNGIISVPHLLKLYNSHKATFKAFSYDYGSDGRLVIYSHAPASRKTILVAAREMQQYLNKEEKKILNVMILKFHDTTLIGDQKLSDKDLIPIIDAINRVVKARADKNELSVLIKQSGEYTQLYSALENRDDPKDDMNNVHGHDVYEFGRRITLNTHSGRSDLSDKHYIGRLATLNYTTSFPWAEVPPTAAECNEVVPEMETLATTHPDQQYKWTSITHTPKPIPFHDNSENKLYGYTASDDLPDTVPALRAILFPFTAIGSVIDALSCTWVENKTARFLTTPLRWVGEIIKFPLAIITGALGMLFGTVAMIFEGPESAPLWQPILAGLSDGLNPFAPNMSGKVARFIEEQTAPVKPAILPAVALLATSAAAPAAVVNAAPTSLPRETVVIPDPTEKPSPLAPVPGSAAPGTPVLMSQPEALNRQHKEEMYKLFASSPW